MKRGDVWLVNMEPAFGSEIRKIRPAVVVQNDKGLQRSKRTIVAPITSQRVDNLHHVEVPLQPGQTGLKKRSKVLCNQVRCVDQRRLIKHIGSITVQTNLALNYALKIALDLY